MLAYLVRLTKPVTVHGRNLPGWWSPVSPGGRVDAAFPGGHANTGMAHGITGPLTLLAAALRRGIAVEGHIEAIERILDGRIRAFGAQAPGGVFDAASFLKSLAAHGLVTRAEIAPDDERDRPPSAMGDRAR